MAAKTCARIELDTPVGWAPVAPAPAPVVPPVVGAPAPPARPRCTGPICRENMNLYGIQGRMYNPRARPPQHECTVCGFVPKWFPMVGSLLVYKRLCELLAWLSNGRVFLNVMIIIATVRKLRNLALLRSTLCVAPCTSVV